MTLLTADIKIEITNDVWITSHPSVIDTSNVAAVQNSVNVAPVYKKNETMLVLFSLTRLIYSKSSKRLVFSKPNVQKTGLISGVTWHTIKFLRGDIPAEVNALTCATIWAADRLSSRPIFLHRMSTSCMLYPYKVVSQTLRYPFTTIWIYFLHRDITSCTSWHCFLN